MVFESLRYAALCRALLELQHIKTMQHVLLWPVELQHCLWATFFFLLFIETIKFMIFLYKKQSFVILKNVAEWILDFVWLEDLRLATPWPGWLNYFLFPFVKLGFPIKMFILRNQLPGRFWCFGSHLILKGFRTGRIDEQTGEINPNACLLKSTTELVF